MKSKSMLVPVLIGAAAVPAVMLTNYLAAEHYRGVWLAEAASAVHRELGPNAVISKMSFPMGSKRRDDPDGPSPKPTTICGYVDGRMFKYQINEKQLAIGSASDRCEYFYQLGPVTP